MKILISPVDGREFDVESMTRRQLRDLHYAEEVRIAKLVQSYPAFSEERKKLLNAGYAFVESVMECYRDTVSFGASNATVQLVCSIITNMQRERTKRSNREIVVYEAGVGTGYAAKDIIKIPNVQFCGCDICILSSMKDIMKEHSSIRVNEDTLYSDLLNMPDHSIDIFYADNVFEHLMPDEAPAIMVLLKKKVKKGGKLVLFIPNRYTGPHDISTYYLPQGRKATGFHFMELAYVEGIFMGVKNGFWPRYVVKKDGAMFRFEKDMLYLKNLIKVIKEWLYSKADNRLVRDELLSNEFGAYVLEKI